MVKRKAVAPRKVPRGQRGAKGAKGAKGDRGPSATPDYILSVVETQFHGLTEQLHVQLVRTGQIQVELDRYHRDVVEIRTQLSQVHTMLKQYVTNGPKPGAPRDTKTKSRDSAD